MTITHLVHCLLTQVCERKTDRLAISQQRSKRNIGELRSVNLTQLSLQYLCTPPYQPVVRELSRVHLSGNQPTGG